MNPYALLALAAVAPIALGAFGWFLTDNAYDKTSEDAGAALMVAALFTLAWLAVLAVVVAVLS